MKASKWMTAAAAVLGLLGAVGAQADDTKRTVGEYTDDKVLHTKVWAALTEDKTADASEINLEVARSMLGYHGVTPQTASDGHEALRMVEAGAYDLIFMDCMMPGIDGYETVRRIRRLEATLGREPRASIVALTANVGDSDVRQCLDAGMDDFLAKPVSLQTIGRALDTWTQNRK